MMKWKIPSMLLAVLILASAGLVRADTVRVPQQLKGSIITSPTEFDVPEKNVSDYLRKQDRDAFDSDQDDRWVVYLVAFFNHPLPTDRIGLVVLDPNGEPVVMAQVPGKRGQRNLSTQIVVEGIRERGQPHVIQLYYARDGKPIVLAKKSIILK